MTRPAWPRLMSAESAGEPGAMTAKDAAQYLAISVRTLKRMDDEGAVKGFRYRDKGQRFYAREALDNLIRQRQGAK